MIGERVRLGDRVKILTDFIEEGGELLQMDHDYGLYKILLDGEMIPLWFNREDFEVLEDEA